MEAHEGGGSLIVGMSDVEDESWVEVVVQQNEIETNQRQHCEQCRLDWMQHVDTYNNGIPDYSGERHTFMI